MTARPTTTPMSKSEREELQRHIRQRAKVLKSVAKQRSIELLAEFENQMGSKYSFDRDEVWANAHAVAKAEIKKANERVAQRCAELGIPKSFAPSIECHWFDRGENVLKERRAELRKMATSRIAAIEAKAITDIELQCLQAQTQLAQAGLTSEAAQAFITALPLIEILMPALSFDAIADEAEPPIVEQLVSPGALRQRRYRERHRNAPVTSQNASALPKPESTK
jgi:hypothetical protein